MPVSELRCVFAGCDSPPRWFVRARVPIVGEPHVHVRLGEVCQPHHNRLHNEGAEMLHDELELFLICLSRGKYVREGMDYYVKSLDGRGAA